jgi:hypothetical protein
MSHKPQDIVTSEITHRAWEVEVIPRPPYLRRPRTDFAPFREGLSTYLV